jgi:hypothetical protein
MKIFKRLIWKNSHERGISLTEAAVALMLLAGAVTTLVMGMSSGALAVNKDEQEVTAQGLARTQLEYAKEYAYDPDAVTYPSVSAPAGYAVTAGVSAVPDTNGNIQKITATVTRGGSTVFTLQDYKVNR